MQFYAGRPPNDPWGCGGVGGWPVATLERLLFHFQVVVSITVVGWNRRNDRERVMFVLLSERRMRCNQKQIIILWQQNNYYYY